MVASMPCPGLGFGKERTSPSRFSGFCGMSAAAGVGRRAALKEAHPTEGRKARRWVFMMVSPLCAQSRLFPRLLDSIDSTGGSVFAGMSSALYGIASALASLAMLDETTHAVGCRLRSASDYRFPRLSALTREASHYPRRWVLAQF